MKDIDILKTIADNVVEMEEELTAENAEKALKMNISPLTIINQGLVKGMNEAGRLFEENEYFVPELLLCSDAMYAGLKVITPHIKKEETHVVGKIVIGVVEGDTHDIGKNLVKVLLQAAGFEIIDLGRNVPAREFVNKAKQEDADLICLSTLMTTTMSEMEKVIKILKEEKMRDKIKVLVGGGPISESFARSIGADGYGENAAMAVRLAKKVLNIPQLMAS